MPNIRVKQASIHYPLVRRTDIVERVGFDSRVGGKVSSSAPRAIAHVRALSDIDLTIDEGDRIAILGPNGSGKSTLLALLAGILPPTSGSVEISGRVTSMLSLNAGLEPKSSGLENIEIRARLMGNSAKLVRERIPEIVRFAELGQFINLPMSTYSSGMKFRLSFAIGTAFDPQIIVMDEWLSAGDKWFRDKVANRLHGMVRGANIFVLASHNRDVVAKICSKVIVLNSGSIGFVGAAEKAFQFIDDGG